LMLFPRLQTSPPAVHLLGDVDFADVVVDKLDKSSSPIE